ncbi:MAG: glycosyltransferase [Clostridia bacterium]|nr:glycosyltransferase [Clostridia bacterium]
MSNPFKKVIGLIKYPRYRRLYDSLLAEVSALKAENADLRAKTEKAETELSAYISAVEKQQYKESLLIKGRMDALNTATNRILYDNELKSLPADKSYTPKVSLIIPVYNGEKYLEEALRCAFSQTYKNLEIIAVNDGSTDSTDEILGAFGDRIVYIKKENGGVSSALNAGIKAMTGEYFAWLSHDDLIDSDHIENLVEYLRHHRGEKVIPYSAFRLIDENGKLLAAATVNGRLNMFDYKISVTDKYAMLLFGEINGGSVLIPKEAFSEHGLFDENRRITQERDMWSRLIKEYRFVCIPFDTASIRIHGEQVSSDKETVAKKSMEKNLEIIDEIYDLIKTEEPARAKYLYEYLKLHYYCISNDKMCEALKEKDI